MTRRLAGAHEMTGPRERVEHDQLEIHDAREVHEAIWAGELEVASRPFELVRTSHAPPDERLSP